MVRVGDAEPHGYRQLGPSPNALDQRCCIGRQALLRAGNAHARNGVNKALGVFRNRFKPFVGAGGCSQKNRRKLHALHLGQVFGRLFHNQIGHQHAIRAGSCGVVGKFAKSVAQNRIQVGKNDQPRSGPRCANFRSQRQHILEPRSPRHGPLARSLNHRPISEWIAERYAQLDHRRARVNGRNRNGARGGKVGIAGRQIHDQPGFMFKENRHWKPLRVPHVSILRHGNESIPENG